MNPQELDQVVDDVVKRLGRRLVVGLPLGLGKPNRLVNAFYRRAREDRQLELEFVTALSLDPPTPSSELERRFLEPFVDRHFGTDYPRLEYVADLREQTVPENVRVTEFYLQSGTGLGNSLMQRHYVSSNYTHVARDLVDRGVNVLVQLVARPSGEGQKEAGSDVGRLSLSSNPDLTLEVARRLEAAGRPHLRVAQPHPELPFMYGDAVVQEDFFHRVLPPEHHQPLFALPRTPVSAQDYWVGLHASTLVADGGTLQIGIGALSDALVHALLLRHQDNTAYRDLVEPGSEEQALIDGLGGLDPFHEGLYGASEMFMDGFMHLYREGILSRRVYDDIDRQRAANAKGAGSTPGPEGEDDVPEDPGAVMDAGFFLGSRPFYEFLRGLGPDERRLFRMMSVERINQLYGGSEELEVLQRRRARFFNTCMMTTATGAAVSDGLDDHRVVSGVGGQYNFVAMAHAMADGRSVLMMRSTRESGGEATSNVVWEYPHVTIPRHLRDLVVTEYGAANLRGRTDEECIQALVQITDRRFQDALVRRAQEAGKLASDWQVPDSARSNTPERIKAELPAGLFPTYPFGSDFTPVEERLVEGLRTLEHRSGSRQALLATLLRGRPAQYPEELARMGLDRPRGFREHLYARLLAGALG
ncbi:MAG: acetyl-CoA hydrolase/transferase C-terminal domain-containing protein [Gemmatimonadota bacterium]